MKKPSTKKEKKPFRFTTDETAKEIALGFINNKFFCSDQIHESSNKLLHIIFMPLAFMEQKMIDDWKKKKVQHLYAPMSAAGPRGINGYPCFAECAPLTEEDYKAVRGYEQKLREAMKTALEEPHAKEVKASRKGAKVS